ncbi:uncharacterized protein [Drosophila takahashii]|uniref:uncharacterized protein n=1 Tax=Drosophila takahashii TaxID=29030 RepID=UPI001CF8A322|nr:uncharacterized protein LOC108066843 [Drosophila takahashii]XP_044248671.1 uncharacterized protein LOC108066843 [Drosophila takahashii]
MKLTILFIVMHLLVLLAIRANDLPLDQQAMAARLQELQREVAHPWSTPCIRNCLAEKGSLVDRPGECQQAVEQFDCTLYCMFEAEARY